MTYNKIQSSIIEGITSMNLQVNELGSVTKYLMITALYHKNLVMDFKMTIHRIKS